MIGPESIYVLQEYVYFYVGFLEKKKEITSLPHCVVMKCANLKGLVYMVCLSELASLVYFISAIFV